MFENIYENIYVEGINLNLKSKNKKAILKEMYKGLENCPYILDKEKAFEDLMLREELGSTGIGKGVAIPHAKTNNVLKIIITIGILEEAIDYDSIDNDKVKIIFMFFAPIELSREYLMILARISRLIKEESFRNKLIEAKNSEDILEIIKHEEIK